MANTSYLRYTVEPWIREQLADRYGQGFAPLVLPLAPGGAHEFDAVSEDRRIVVSIKASSGLTSGGNHPTGKVATCLNEVYFLTLVDADVRVLMLTNPAFHAIFTKTTAGQIASGIGVELLPLPRICSERSTGSRSSRAGRCVATPPRPPLPSKLRKRASAAKTWRRRSPMRSKPASAGELVSAA